MAVTKLVSAGSSTGSQGGPPSAGALDTSLVIPEMGGSINSIRAEVDDAFADMKTFVNREPDEIMRMASGHSARLSELRVMCMRIEDHYPPARMLRMRELEPCLDELREQRAHGSRLHSVRELDWKMEAGDSR